MYMELIRSIPSFLVAIIILVTFHEFGHFYVARLCGVRVLRFSFGFGKVLWRRYDNQGTEYTFSALPFGGYVKMLDERDGEVPVELLAQSFTRKPIWQRMAIILAGPVANLILAIALFWVLLLFGESGLIPVVGKVESGSIAAAAGLEVGQEIVAVDGDPTPTEQVLAQHLIARLGESGPIRFVVKYPQSNLQYEQEALLDKWLQGEKDPDPIKGLGLEMAMPLEPIVGSVVPTGAGARAGFKVGDRLQKADEQVIVDWRDWFNYVRAHPSKLIAVEIKRNDTVISLQVTPESFEEKGVSYGRVGMLSQPPAEKLFRNYDYSVTGALFTGIKRTWDTSGFVLLSVKKLILGEISTKNLSGLISIAKVAGSSAQNGLKSFVGFIALLSVFLGVFNLLPVPVLDGGHLVYLTLELIRGKPVSEKIQMLGFQLGLMLVVSLSVLAMYNDITRL